MSVTAGRCLKVTDNRSGETTFVPVKDDTIDTTAFAKLGLTAYDHGYMNTAVCRSAISYIDGDKGILRYRGYDIEELAEKSTFLEVAYLLIFGELPSGDQLEKWTTRVQRHTFIHENMIDYLKSFRYDAHPMGMLVSAIAAMSTFHPEASTALCGEDIYENESMVNKQIFRCLGKLPTLAACAYRHRIGRSYNTPSNELEYTENFLYMLDRLSETNYTPHPQLAHALDVIFILHADHELNCSTAAMRQMASTGTDPFVCLAGASSALYGPSHGGANEAALRMLEEIGSIEKIPAFIEEVKAKKRRLMGFGHRVYKSYDPRAKILKKISSQVFDIMGRSDLVNVALELERIALSDEYFIKRNLYPNVDFYSGLIYKAMGFPTDFFPVLFCIARTAGWLAHWREQLHDRVPIFRPQQVDIGQEKRHYKERLGDSAASILNGIHSRKNIPPSHN
ncbi:citrate (Si)-synthase [Batrachochytrium dendrobatidis JEL423]|nr:citrate (Si)-synthase [Batrachochytrium dendrobatidis JEL423]